MLQVKILLVRRGMGKKKAERGGAEQILANVRWIISAGDFVWQMVGQM